MKYTRPEMNIERFDLVEEITAGTVSAGAGSDVGGDATTTTTTTSTTVGDDLIVG